MNAPWIEMWFDEEKVDHSTPTWYSRQEFFDIILPYYKAYRNQIPLTPRRLGQELKSVKYIVAERGGYRVHWCFTYPAQEYFTKIHTK